MKNTISPALLKDLDKSFNALFNKGRLRVAGFVKRLKLMVVKSTAAEEMYGWLKDVPALKKNPAELEIAMASLDGHSIKNHEFKGGLSLPRTAIEDDLTGTFGPVAEQLGQRGEQVADFELIDLLLASFTTAKAFTTKAFFATDHRVGKVTFSNKDTKKLSAANFQTGYAALRNMQDGEGKPLFTLQDPSSVFLVVGPDYEVTADSIVTMAKTAAGADNPNFKKAQVVVIPGLGHMWFILDCGQVVTPFIFQDRLPLKLTASFDETSANVLMEDKYVWKARSRCAVGTGDPHFAWGSTGADAA